MVARFSFNVLAISSGDKPNCKKAGIVSSLPTLRGLRLLVYLWPHLLLKCLDRSLNLA